MRCLSIWMARVLPMPWRIWAARPAEATWKCGVDVLSLGATKNGALGAEAVMFFDPAMARDFERRRKRAGQLMSKLRFLSAQLIAYLKNELWLDNARHANAMAHADGAGLEAVGRRKAPAPRAGQRIVRRRCRRERSSAWKARDSIFIAGRAAA